MIKRKGLTLLAGAVGFFSALTVNAAEMNFNGILIDPPPCEINNGKDIAVIFNKVGINKVNGDNYRQKVDFSLDCGVVLPWELTLTLTTTSVASFSDATVQTDISGLGIRVYIDDTPMLFGKPYPVSSMAAPVIEAVPVKDAAQELVEGHFSASASLKAEYQ